MTLGGITTGQKNLSLVFLHLKEQVQGISCLRRCLLKESLDLTLT